MEDISDDFVSFDGDDNFELVAFTYLLQCSSIENKEEAVDEIYRSAKRFAGNEEAITNYIYGLVDNYAPCLVETFEKKKEGGLNISKYGLLSDVCDIYERAGKYLNKREK